MKFSRIVNALILTWSTSSCAASVQTGLDRVTAHRALFQGKRVGVIANHTAYDSQGTFIVDVFREMPGVQVVALFSPEHGLYGTADAGASIDSQTDPASGLPVRSLYGQTRKPTPDMLRDLDLLVFDIQDIGARFYTYVYTMSLVMEAAAEQGKAFVVLDRPNPIDGRTLEGPILESQFATFVGLYPIPVRHGMTAGELARLFNGQGWLANGTQVDLAVVPMQGWQRDIWYDQTELTFRKPSPNMPDLQTATVYPGLCLLEGTNVSEGRGTPRPFRQFGAPWLDSKAATASSRSGPASSSSTNSIAWTPTISLGDKPTSIVFVARRPSAKQSSLAGFCLRSRRAGRPNAKPFASSAGTICSILLHVPADAIGGNAISASFVRKGLTRPSSSGCTRLVRIIR